MKIELSKAKSDYEIILLEKDEIKTAADFKDFDFYDYKGEGLLNLSEKRRIYSAIKKRDFNAIANAAAAAIRAISKLKIKSARLCFDFKSECELKAAAQGILLGAYSYEK